MHLSPFLAAFAAATLVSSADAVSCIGESGQKVDWFFVYKMHENLNYAYWDSSSSGPLTLSSTNLNSSSTAVARTIQQWLNKHTSLAQVIWNDEPPVGLTDDIPLSSIRLSPPVTDPTSNTSGHSKGMLVADSNGGFWMTHSVPLFPDADVNPFAWVTSKTYAQDFLCLSVSASMVEQVGQQLQHIDPLITRTSAVPIALASTYPSIVDLLQGTRSGVTAVRPITTVGGNSFTHFAKPGAFDQDIFENLVQPNLKQPFSWQTWRRSPYMDSYCPSQYSYASVNVQELAIGGSSSSRTFSTDKKMKLNLRNAARQNAVEDELSQEEKALVSASSGSVSWKYTDDHSKWGVSTGSSSSPWVCVSDMNRMESQWVRGGGTVCFKNTGLWKALSGVITNADSC